MDYNINVAENVNKMLVFAKKSAQVYNNGEVATEHLVFGALSLNDCYCCKLLNSCGVNKENFEQILFESIEEEVSSKIPELTPRSKQVFVMANNLAKELNSNIVDVEHIVFSILMNSNCVAVNILDKVFNVNIIELKNKLLEYIKTNYHAVQQKPAKTETSNAKRTEKEVNAKTDWTLPKELEGLGIDLTEKARQGKIDPIIGRDKEIARVLEILCRKTKNNPCLIGEAGVGKSAVAEGLALKIIENDVPSELKNKTIFSLDIGGLMSGTKFRGTLEKKLKDAITAIISHGNMIVFIDEIHTLAQTNNEKGEVSPSDILKPYLARGEIKTIGATTQDEYRKYFEKDKALERRFQPVTINAPTKQDTFEILKGVRDSYENYHGVRISDEALKTAIELSDRYITTRNFPDKAIDLVDEASSRAKLIDQIKPSDIVAMENRIIELKRQKKFEVMKENYEQAIVLREEIFRLQQEVESLSGFYGTQSLKKIVGSEDIASVVSLWTGIPVNKITETEVQKLINLENILHGRVIGQDKAIENVARAVRRNRVGIRSGNRPIGSFLFLGPTGVGKTELSKAIAEALFDDENCIIRLDMSEYMETNSVSKLIGSPPGYVGYEEGGQLTEKVRRKPYSVVLLDEIEKAHEDVLNLLLQILDDGRLTDSQGRLVNFENTIVVMTSNVGSDILEKMIAGKTESEQEKTIQNYLSDYFKPELINRIDNISLFHSLTKEDLAKIAKIMLMSLLKRLESRNITLKLTEKSLNYLITKGYNVEFGARPLRRLIEQKIEDVIAEDILLEKLTNNSVVEIDEKDDKLIFTYLAKCQ